MTDLSDDPAMQDEIIDDLSENFPPGYNRAATQADGPMRITFEEWKVPTLGQRSRDPINAQELSEGSANGALAQAQNDNSQPQGLSL